MRLDSFLNPVAIYHLKAPTAKKVPLYVFCFSLGVVTLFIPHLAYFAYRKISHLLKSPDKIETIQRRFFRVPLPDSGTETLKSWVENYAGDFIAHASSCKNFEKIVKDGFVKPAELVLREGKEVEYEAGSRWEDRDIASISTYKKDYLSSLSYLDESSKKRLETLQAFKREELLTEEEINEFQSLKKEIKKKGREAFNSLYDSPFSYFKKLNQIPQSDEDFAQKIKDHIYELGEKLVASDRFLELKKKKILTFEEEEELKILLRTKEGAPITFRRKWLHKTELPIPIRSQFFDTRDKLLQIAYDEHNNRAFDKYLAHKYEKWIQKGYEVKKINELLHHARTLIIHPSKLNYDVRVCRNGIAWAYGPFVILRGNPQLIDRGDAHGDLDSVDNEHFLLAPWQNKGDFYSLSLQEKETLVLGPKKELSLFAKQLNEKGIQFIYLENLTEEQKKIFNVPEKLN